jgi:hypothetical protein
MRISMMILAALLIGGCASQPSQQAQTQQTGSPATMPSLAQSDSSALALACDPPCTSGQPALYLDRDSRQPAAFAGYDTPTVSFSYVRTDDNYNPDKNGNYDREAVTERVSVSTR